MVLHISEFDASFGQRSLKEKRILCLDEQGFLGEKLNRALNSGSFEFVSAAMARETAMRLCLERFDMVILDLENSTSTWETLQRISEVNPLIPVIVLADLPSERDLPTLAGVAAILEKPVNFGLLKEVLYRLGQEPFEKRLHRIAAHRPILIPAQAV